jgi:hypothetical protein
MTKNLVSPLFTRCILLGMLILLGGVCWHYVFGYYVTQTGFVNDVFRLNFGNNIMPIYGRVKLAASNNFLIIGTALGLCFSIYRYKTFLFSNENYIANYVLFLYLILILLFAVTESAERVYAVNVHYKSFANDLHYYNSVSDILKNYVSKQSVMDIHNQHYPPGNLIVLKIFENVGLMPFAKWFFVLTSLCLISYGCYLLKGEYSNGYANLFSLLLCTCPGIIIFPSLDNSLWYAALALVSILSFVLYIKKASRHHLFVCVLSLVIFAFFSFKVILILVAIAIYFLALIINNNKAEIQKYIIVPIYILSGFAAVYLSLYVFSGFNLLDCMLNSSHLNMKVMQTNGWDNVWRYLLRSTGNYFGLCVGAGIVLLILYSKPNMNIKSHNLFYTTNAVILFGCFSGLFFMETERVFVCLIPLIVMSASFIIENISAKQKAIIVIVALTFSVLQELFLQHYL